MTTRLENQLLDRIREQRDLLDECEKALHNAAIYRENADFTLINATLTKLRAAQEKADE